MSEAFELYNEKGKPCGVWCCGKCRKLVLSPIWSPSSKEPRSTKEAAEKCCTPPLCDCGKPSEYSHGGECKECRSVRWSIERAEQLERRLAAATDVTEGYEGPVCIDDSTRGDMGDGFFSSAEVAAEYLEDDEDLGEQWAFACTAEVRGIDLDRALEQACDDGYEDMGDRIEIPQSLRDAVDAFNKENERALTLWNVDYSRKVRIIAKAEGATK